MGASEDLASFLFEIHLKLRSFALLLQADLWSVGIILYELLIGYTPFDGSNHIQLLRNIERHDVHIPVSERSKLSPHSTHLIYNLLKRNPIERMSFEVLSSCFLTLSPCTPPLQTEV